ncbi:MAG: two-component system, chemotaxis family, protein-glutamate methylesterase/glutaminase [Gaiellaceae bacterium]|jgi:two-component system chemotaxis response regulator CheB|nr:two-component system, chemotaxis family, protein-glutamate methylesterase/glutaminase [Gaiellaceae bacterium]MDX6478691.1 two-component system, chemotaxis family, protein-glutamate methylesterase/glutaminase [Gaiellaceae bacterium]MDX6492254.1 two-component system, chemotaxis family, protein-glutamate methylesterase/glutaminase [Gaiellaceae bacterium]MDX6508307.1 two-component system, chemotaxis family, protein-glutamate methylesterase/glutaminase [Gaiellaceae bacterium]
MIEIAVIGASWGGLNALTTVLSGLVCDELRATVVIAQHRSPESSQSVLPQLLGESSSAPVREASDKETIEPATIYLAPPDYHLLIEDGHFALATDARVQFARPSIDVLFETAAEVYGDRALGVILTGANADGAAGLRSIRERGGLTVVQDPATAERSAMPAAALAATPVDAVLPLEEIGPFLVRHCCGEPARVR